MVVMVYFNSCARIPKFLDEYGSAAACGVSRSMGMASLFLYVSMMGYATFVVWSRCEQLRLSGSNQAFDELVGGAQRIAAFRPPAGLFGTGPKLLDAQPIEYGSLAPQPYGGGAKIFYGKTHDTNFPPTMGVAT